MRLLRNTKATIYEHSTHFKSLSSPQRIIFILSFVIYILIATDFLTQCMDIHPNPGPTTSLASSTSSETTTRLRTYSRSFNIAKRLHLKLTRYRHHLKNYLFYWNNNYLPPGLLPKLQPPLHASNRFFKQWRFHWFYAARCQLELLIKECKFKIFNLEHECRVTMEHLKSSCSPETFLLYRDKIFSMASSLECLLSKRRNRKFSNLKKYRTNRFKTNFKTKSTNLNDKNNELFRTATTNESFPVRNINIHFGSNYTNENALTDNNVNHYNNSNTINSTSVSTSNLPLNSQPTSTRRRNRRSFRPKSDSDHTSVINLSNTPLSIPEKSVLSKGLTFCPTPHYINWPELMADFNDFSRRMRLKEYFHSDRDNNPIAPTCTSDTSNKEQINFHFHNKSNWTPPSDRDPFLNAFLNAVKHDIKYANLSRFTDNLTSDEREALKQLKARTDIIIKPALLWTNNGILMNARVNLTTLSFTNHLRMILLMKFNNALLSMYNVCSHLIILMKN